MAKAVNIARSHRLDGIGEYYFSRRLREIAEIEAATGRQIVKLAMGSPDLPPHQSVIDRLAKEAQRPDVHKYMSYKGEPILRKAFADWYKKWYRTELDYNNEVLPLIGSKEGIMHICMTFLNKGDKVLVPNPGYPTYSAAVRLSGGEMVPYALNKQTGFYPDFEAIEKAGLDGVKMMLVNYPNMPTGQTPTMELFQKIVDFGARHNILIVHDNPYSFIRNAAAPISIMEAEGARDVALEMNSLSKGHSMAGWRVGVVVGKKEWIDSILTFKSNMDSGMFYPIQAAADTALALGGPFAIRYPRGKEDEALAALGCTGNDFDMYPAKEAADTVLVSYSGETAQALHAAELAGQQGLWVDVCKLCVIHPLPDGLVDALAAYRTVVFAEEGIAAGGIGEHLCAALLRRGWCGHWRHVAVPNTGIDHATVPQLRQALGLDAQGLLRVLKEECI